MLEMCQSFCACSVRADSRAGWQWPSAFTAMPPARSMYFAPFGIPYAAALSAFGDDGGEGEVGGQVVLHDAVRVFCRYGREIMRCLASGFNVQAV